MTSRPAPPFNTSLIVPIDLAVAVVRRDRGPHLQVGAGFNV